MTIYRLLPLLLMWSASLLFGQSSITGGNGASVTPPHGGDSCHASAVPNVNQLALLRWYGANVVNTFATGGRPNGIAFDGENMWVVGGPANSVSKIRANDGALLGTFPVGNIPGYAAFDGANIWVTNLLDNTVSKLRASDGANLGHISDRQVPLGNSF